jgi:TonB family protein
VIARNSIYFQIMKNLFAFLFFCASLTSAAQTIERFYDHNWKYCEPAYARFYSTLKSTDSGWLANDYYLATKRLQMTGLYTDTAGNNKNGFFKYYHPNGYLKSKGQYINNQKNGLWVSYYSNGAMSDSAVYKNGVVENYALSWDRDGNLTDSLFVDTNGFSVQVAWFSNGNIAMAGRLNEKKEKYGRWQYYFKEGGLSSSEIYENDKLIRFTFFTKEGKPIENANYEVIPATFPGGTQAWANHLTKKLYFPNFTLQNTNSVSVVVEFEINEEGKIQNAEVTVPLHPEFDRIALEAIKKSPNWIPAKMHNRNIVYKNRQSVSFYKQE